MTHPLGGRGLEYQQEMWRGLRPKLGGVEPDIIIVEPKREADRMAATMLQMVLNSETSRAYFEQATQECFVPAMVHEMLYGEHLLTTECIVQYTLLFPPTCDE